MPSNCRICHKTHVSTYDCVPNVRLEINRLKEINKQLASALEDIAKGMIDVIPDPTNPENFLRKMWQFSQARANQALTAYKEK